MNTLLSDDKKIEGLTSPFSVYNYVLPSEVYGGTETSENYSLISDYIWENHSNFYSLIRRFNKLKEYEKKQHMPSEELLRKWRANDLGVRSEQINDWLTLYLQIKSYIE